MTTTLLIARHGNTFDPGDTVLRVGRRTDLPLSHSGKQQATVLGQYLATHYPELHEVYTSPLQRAHMTATLALAAFDQPIPVHVDTRFTEVDYGVDEGQPETEVRARLGDAVLQAWEESDTPPPGWLVDADQIKADWRAFLSRLTNEHQGQTILVVTSQGIARFVKPLVTSAMSASGKLATAALACLTYDNNEHWQLQFWNHKPVLRSP
jgi:2,3-bisphosphoglycerate-dependent phosphoglycerate mutase